MAATIRDIKKRTGLSLATISKYLNGGNVLPENRILIEEAINELHYEVNELARGLVTHKTKTIGVLAYDIQCLFVGSMLHYLGMELHKKGYGMLICDSCNDEKLQKENLQQESRWNIGICCRYAWKVSSCCEKSKCSGCSG